MFPFGSAAETGGCNTDILRETARRSFPEYSADSRQREDGVVLLTLSRGDQPAFHIALRVSGTRFFTSVTAVDLAPAEQARISAAVGRWYDDTAVQDALRQCSSGPPLDEAEGHRLVRNAANRRPDTLRLSSETAEAALTIVALFLALALLLPSVFQRPRGPFASKLGTLELTLLITTAGVSCLIASLVAFQLAPETDEGVTLGAAYEPMARLLSWSVGSEPYNPPGPSALFGGWLRVWPGILSGRLLSIALIPPTAALLWLALKSLLPGVNPWPSVALLLLSPAWIRLAAISRGYALASLAFAAGLASLGRSIRQPSQGGAVAIAAILALWSSYLLWPFALALPLLARLESRDRLRSGLAVGLVAASLVPRIVNGVGNAATKTGSFELTDFPAVVSFLTHAIGQLPPLGYEAAEGTVDLAPPFAALLILGGLLALGIRLAKGESRHGGVVLLASVLLTSLPVLALLRGGLGIRERHVLALQCAVTIIAGLLPGGLLRTSRQRLLALAGGGLFGLGLVLSAAGSRQLLRAESGWIANLPDLAARTQLLVSVPREHQMTVHVMLTSDSPLASPGTAWLPVCETDSEWWCRQAGDLVHVSVDEVTPGILTAAAESPSSLWVFDVPGPELAQRVPPPIREHCESAYADSRQHVFLCTGESLRAPGPTIR